MQALNPNSGTTRTIKSSTTSTLERDGEPGKVEWNSVPLGSAHLNLVDFLPLAQSLLYSKGFAVLTRNLTLCL